MPTQKRPIYPGEIYHVYNRGNQGMPLFREQKDYDRFLWKIREYKERHPVSFLAYCVMPNHFHFLLREPLDPTDDRPRPLGSHISHFMHLLQTSYSKYFLARYDDFSGRVFQGIYNAKQVSEETYLFSLAAYIHDNPVRKKLSKDPKEWPYNSYLDLAGIRADSIITHPEALDSINHEKLWHDYAKNRESHWNKIQTFV